MPAFWIFYDQFLYFISDFFLKFVILCEYSLERYLSMKKFCILILLAVCGVNIAHSQSWKELNQKVKECIKTGNYSQCIELAEKSKIQAEREFGKENNKYADAISILANLYYKMGNYAKAEQLVIENMNIRRKVLGKKHPYYATSLNNVAVLYYMRGNYIEAEPLYIEALKIYGKKMTTYNNLNYLSTSNNLALLYNTSGNSAKATEVYNNWSKKYGMGPIMEKFFAKRSRSIDTSKIRRTINNPGILVQSFSNKIKTNALDPLNPLVAEVNLIITDSNQKNVNLLNVNEKIAIDAEDIWNKLEPLINDFLNSDKKFYGSKHPYYTNKLIGYAVSYFIKDNYEKAEPLLIQANDNLNDQINQTFGILSEEEKKQFLNNKINYYFDIINSFVLNRKRQNPSVVSISYNNELAHKGMLLQSNSALRQAVHSSSDNKLIETYDKYISIHEALSKLYLIPVPKRTISIDSLENEAEKLEIELAGRGKDLPGFENLTGLSKIKWQDIQRALRPDEAAIEFVNFHYYDKRLTDSTFYCALVLRNDYTLPKMIYLFEEKQLRNFISLPQATDNAWYITQLYSNKPNLSLKNNQATSKNILYQLTWQPIDSLLKGINTIYLAPDGLLNKVDFSAIPVTDSTYLLDKYRINILSSTRILTKAYQAKLPSSVDFKATLYGGITYDLDSSEMIASARQYQKPKYNLIASRSFYSSDTLRGYMWSYLPGTLTEVTHLKKLFKSNRITSTLYTGKQATEESFKHLADNGKSPELVHIATHGFFFPEIEPKKDEIEKIVFKSFEQADTSNEPVFTYSENPLLRSGLLLAGASRTWNKLPEIEGVEDGTLTAYEVSNINLSNTQLVVLSACETGLGDVKGSEGVFGLQRGFKMAGVRYIIMSLWQVPDYQTSELMELFYTNWLKGMDIKGAFRMAQGTMRKRYDPFYWAAFVFIE